MSAYYSIVQYVPDIVAEERINIGVIAFDQERVQCSFLKNWSRVKCFVSGGDVSFLRDVADDFYEASRGQLAFAQRDGRGRLNEDAINEMSRTWRNTIQVTQPRGSLLPLEQLLPKMTDRFLRTRKPERPEHRGRSDARNIAERGEARGY
jgi:hypothetical protein